MIYNFNLGIGWASSGVEYAQSYRANIFRQINQEAKFIFTDMFYRDNIAEMTRNIGFLDEEVIWLYTYFSDFKTSPVTYTLEQLVATLTTDEYTYSRQGNVGKLIFSDNNFYRVYFTNDSDELVHRVEMVQNNCLIRKDYFTYGRIYSEYYAPLDNAAHLYHRRFFNEDGSVVYDEIIDGENSCFKFKDRIFYSKTELVGYFVQSLKLTEQDIVIIDRTTDIGQVIFENVKPAKVGIVIHADHFSESATDEDYILWNNYYEYPFSMNRHVDFFVTATEAQNSLLKEQFEKYMNVSARVETIPVGSIDKLRYPTNARKKHSFITASRLASEKHIDWLIDAVSKAHEKIEDISLDIYGRGALEQKLREQIASLNAGDYIHLMGHHDLTDVYINYEGYLSASTSEGFGLTILEAIGSGLPIIGFDVRYGNQEFVADGKNGFLMPYMIGLETQLRQNRLVDCIIRLCQDVDIEQFSQASYEKAKSFLTDEVKMKWKKTIETTV